MKMLSSAWIALGLLVGNNAALADPWHDHGRNDRGGWHDRDDGRRDRDGHGHWEHRYYSDRRYEGRPRWGRGNRYDGPLLIVNDYSHYRLAPPPYGYRWVRDGGSYLLVSMGDNVILDMIIR
ncbi:RcnB family protein [Dyella sp. C9]|uniref:RcnB family protein n=1 Tax=Dyella sp. C9 TaxID=2202154 RepID=UPI000DEFC427|nr:RcnB family protein [Dyella sp. C9]